MNLSKVQIETERLRLVPGTVNFAEQIFSEYRDPVIQYMNYGPPESLEVLKARMKNREVEMQEGEQLFMAILLKETGEFLGCMALEDLKEENPEMGGWLKQSAHGHGYGREAATALKQWAEENLEYDHILWPCATANTSSCKLAESLGGKIHREYEKKTARGTVWPFVDYWISKNSLSTQTMKPANTIIKTENLLLQAITLEYKKEIFREFTPEITTYMFPKSPEKIEETIEFIEAAMKGNEAGSDFSVVVLNKATKEYLGNAGIHNIKTKTPELGVWIKKSAQGNSYGKEAMIALKKWADENLDYECILYPVVDVNYASRRIPEFLGGKIFREYDEKNMSGKKLHLLEYRIYPTQK